MPAGLFAADHHSPEQVGEAAVGAGRVGVIAEVAHDLHNPLLFGGGFEETRFAAAEQPLPGQFQN